jgi:tetratricopeptide (TPR) repeat protein
LALGQGDTTTAKMHMEQAAALGQAAGDRHMAAAAQGVLGIVAADQGDFDGAEARFASALTQMRELGDRGAMAEMHSNLGWVADTQGDLDRAEAAYEEALARQADLPVVVAEQLTRLGKVAWRRGELGRAAALEREALVLLRGLGRHHSSATVALECLAMTLAAAGQGEQSARLLGAAAALRETVGYPQKTLRRQEMEEAVAPARAALGETAWQAAFAAGCALSLDKAIAEALGGLD